METTARSGSHLLRRVLAPAMAGSVSTPAHQPRGAQARGFVLTSDASSRVHAGTVALTCVVWFVLAFAAIVWSWAGHDPHYFPSPDEAMDRQAAGLVASQGEATMKLDTEDPEDLRFGRFWVSMGDEAIPAYPPVAYYLQGALLVPSFAGGLLVAALSALGIAAFAGGVARLGARRPWIALLAPAAAFPGLYWLMRPWINMSTFLVFMSCALLCWAFWRRSHARSWLFGAVAMAGLAAAVRPDYAPFIFSLCVIAGYADEIPGERRRIVLALAMGAALAVGLNLVLNALTTGNPLTTAYEIVDERRGSEIGGGLPGPLSKLGFLLLPYGVPSFDVVRGQFERYWLDMGPMIVLTLGSAVALVILVLQSSGRHRIALCAAVAVCAAFVLTHVSETVYGANQPTALLRHSVTRYWAPVYLLAAVPLVVLAMSRMREGTWVAALAAACAIAVLGGREIYSGQPESLSNMRAIQGRQAQMVTRWDTLVPDDAVVYSYNLDKILWPHWEIGTLSQSFDHEASASSIARTLGSGRDVYVVQVVWPNTRYIEGLTAALASRDLVMTPLADAEDVYRVTRTESGAVETRRSR